MQRIIIYFFLFYLCINPTWASGNSLMAIKINTLPAHKLRLSFHFLNPVTNEYIHSKMTNTPSLVLEFINSNWRESIHLGHLNKVDDILTTYQLEKTHAGMKMVLNLKQPIRYTESISNHVYTIILSPSLKKKKFTGKPISLNFQHINIRAVLQLIADFTQKNIVVSDQVQGDISLNLKEIPWDEALDIIISTQHLIKHQTADFIFIAPQKNQRIKIQSEFIQINYAKAEDLALFIKDKQNSFLSKKGQVGVDARTNSLWIYDQAKHIKIIKNMVRRLDTPIKQVLIEARIVQVSKDFTQDLGIRWGTPKPNYSAGAITDPNLLLQAQSKMMPYTEKLNLDLLAAPVTGAIPASIGLALAKLSDNILLDLELSALESEGRAELISSPKLITANQQVALIDSGQEIPYQESTSSGATSVSFKKAVLSLKVKPQITPDNKIMMELKINQDRMSTQLFNGVPAILTKEIQTNVLAKNGQTIVLGGIYQQDKSKTVTRIPFIGKLPVVGGLFRHTQMSLVNEELLIFITSKIV